MQHGYQKWCFEISLRQISVEEPLGKGKGKLRSKTSEVVRRMTVGREFIQPLRTNMESFRFVCFSFSNWRVSMKCGNISGKFKTPWFGTFFFTNQTFTTGILCHAQWVQFFFDSWWPIRLTTNRSSRPIEEKYPLGSMSLVYFLTWMVDFHSK